MKKFDLNNTPKKLPFEVPEGYFDEFQRQMQHRVQQEAITRKVFWKQPIWRLAYTSALLLCLGWAYITWMPASNNATELASNALQGLSLENVDDEAILDYLAEEGAVSTADLYNLASDIESTSELIENNFLEEVDVHELDDYM